MSKKIKYVYETGLPFDEMGAKIGFPIVRKIYSGKSKYQKIEIFDLKFWGRTLYLDGVLQATEKDEFIYHEMIVHPPMFCHDYPKKVLIIGGGDGGSLREVLKHKSVEEVLLAEIDEEVIKFSQKYLNKICGNAFDDRRVKLSIGDGRKIIEKYSNYFNVIILDLPDPSDNCRYLISASFYRKVKKSLAKNGIISVQSESFTNQIKLAKTINKNLKKAFKFVRPQRVCIPSYQSGEFSLTMASDFNFSRIKIKELRKKSRKFNLRYWSPEIHLASAVLPKYIDQELNS